MPFLQETEFPLRTSFQPLSHYIHARGGKEANHVTPLPVGLAGNQKPHLLLRTHLITGCAWFLRPALFLQGIFSLALSVKHESARSLLTF